MLNVNLARMSQTEMEDVVSAQCASFGAVTSVRILPPTTHRAYALAVVAMASTEEVDRVMVEFGDLKFGASAIIRLIQDEAQLPVPPKMRSAHLRKRLKSS